MSGEKWKLEKDLCRCCLNEGTFKNLAEPFLYQGEEEIYSEMLLESLDVNIIPVSGPLCTSTYTICEECILRVRDACHFKRLVLSNEKRFHDLYSRNIIQLTSSDLGVKKEAPDSDNEPIEDEVKMEALDDDDNFRLNYDDEVNDDGDNKSDINLDLQAAKKAKAKKPKAKEKAKPRKRAARPAPRKAKAEAGAEEPKEKKDVTIADAPDKFAVDDDASNYTCNICGANYQSLKWLTNHIRRRHESESVEQIPNASNVLENQDQEEKKVVCEICHLGLKNPSCMANHIRTKHGPFTCSECSLQFSSGKGLKDHNRKTHTHVCEICKKKTYRIVEHLRKHDIFKCPHCPAKFQRKLELNSHKRSTHITKSRKIYGIGYTVVENGVNDNSYICNQCGTFCPTLNSLRKHIKTHVPSPKRVVNKTRNKFICDICNKEMSVKYNMVKHIKYWHTPVRCSECQIVCSNPFQLSHHKRYHHPSSIHACGICRFKTYVESRLIVHQRKVHMGEKNEACPHCDATFFNKRMLNNHLVRHNPIKKFECRFCLKKFPRKNTLSMHEKIHLGQKNKVCAICDARFVQKASLNYHMKKYHPEAV